MDASFLDRIRVSPGDEATVVHLIEMAATQIATALVCSAHPAACKGEAPPRDWKSLQAYQVCLEIIHRAMASPKWEWSGVQVLPPPLVHGLVNHPMLNHIVVTMDYTHLLLCEKFKRSAWLEASTSEGTTDPAMQAFVVEAVWSLLTCSSSDSEVAPTKTRGTPHRESAPGGNEKGSPEPRLAVTTKANSQSPPTVDDGIDGPTLPMAMASAPNPNLFSPLSRVPIWVDPSPEASDELQVGTSGSPRPRVSPTMPVHLPLLTKAEEWTLQDKKSHQATRLFRLHHAAECKDGTCALPSCASMKHVLRCCTTRDGMVGCRLPFCFGAKCAILHLQSCDRVEQCGICRDYWQRVAYHTVATMVQKNQSEPQHVKGASESFETPPAVAPAKPSALKRQASGAFEEPTAKKRRSTSEERVV